MNKDICSVICGTFGSLAIIFSFASESLFVEIIITSALVITFISMIFGIVFAVRTGSAKMRINTVIHELKIMLLSLTVSFLVWLFLFEIVAIIVHMLRR